MELAALDHVLRARKAERGFLQHQIAINRDDWKTIGNDGVGSGSNHVTSHT